MLISVIAPAYNEELNLRAFVAETSKVLASLDVDYEIIIIENGSFDRSLELLKELRLENSRLHYVALTRNFGHQGGIITGLNFARGDAVITMDADLQHPPEVIPRLVKQWRDGFLVVNTNKESHELGLKRKLIDRLFYTLFGRVTDLKIGHADFRLLDRKVVNKLLEMPEKEKFLRGLIAWLGFKQTTIFYNPSERLHGETKFPKGHRVSFAMQGITSFSTMPLKMLTKFGFLFLVPSSLYIIYCFGLSLHNYFFEVSYVLPPGWLTLTITIVFFGAIHLLGLGILGEYIGKIYTEAKRRPDFVLKETSLD